MNWSRVRWLLIAVLCLTDLLLGVLLWRNYRGENTVSRAALEDAAALLAEADVRLDPDVVPTEVIRDYVFRVPVTDEAYRAVFEGLVGAKVTSAYLLPASSGTSLLFENGDSVEYYHNLYLSYARSGADRAQLSALTEAFLSGASEMTALERDAAETDLAAAEDFLAALTPQETAGARLRPFFEGIYASPSEPTLRLAVFREQVSYRAGSRAAADINDTRVLVLVKNGTVLYLSGTWVPFLPDETYSIRKLDQLNILFSERSRHLALGGDDAAGDPVGGHPAQHTDAGCEIVSMERLYYMLWDDAGTLYLRPSWMMGYLLENEAHTPLYRKVLCDGVTGGVVRQEEMLIPDGQISDADT